MRVRILAILAAVALAACGGGARPAVERGGVGSCTRIRAERPVRGQLLCEDVWTCVRPPGGPFDRLGLRRIATCDPSTGPIVMYLPGMHMNGEVPFTAAGNDIRLYLAQSGFRVWAVDYRTHAVPPEATPANLATLATWTADTFADDVAWGMGFVKGAEPGAITLMGFSYGAGLAYRVASRGGDSVARLVILDGVAPGATTGGDGPAVIDVGSSRLPYEQRQRLMAAASRGADTPSPVAGYRTAGDALGDVLYSAQSFGGQGGLSNAKSGVSDPQVVATLLGGYDRWWPRAALGGSAVVPARQLPVLAFASTQMGDAWVERVRASAKAFGGEGAQVKPLPKYGHLDVLVGTAAVRDVYEPVRQWVDAGR